MATDQIRQMVNFILQEAHEKANEIRVKVGTIQKDLATVDIS
jgi:vacuolar-type H+-ATPase subunit E/Vma4